MTLTIELISEQAAKMEGLCRISIDIAILIRETLDQMPGPNARPEAHRQVWNEFPHAVCERVAREIALREVRA